MIYYGTSINIVPFFFCNNFCCSLLLSFGDHHWIQLYILSQLCVVGRILVMWLCYRRGRPAPSVHRQLSTSTNGSSPGTAETKSSEWSSRGMKQQWQKCQSGWACIAKVLARGHSALLKCVCVGAAGGGDRKVIFSKTDFGESWCRNQPVAALGPVSLLGKHNHCGCILYTYVLFYGVPFYSYHHLKSYFVFILIYISYKQRQHQLLIFGTSSHLLLLGQLLVNPLPNTG